MVDLGNWDLWGFLEICVFFLLLILWKKFAF